MGNIDPEIQQAAEHVVDEKVRTERARMLEDRKRTRRLTTIGVVVVVLVLIMQAAGLYYGGRGREAAKIAAAEQRQALRNIASNTRSDVRAQSARSTRGHRSILRTLINLARRAGLPVEDLRAELERIDGSGAGNGGT